MPEEKPAVPETKPAGKAKLVVRIVLFAILIVVLITAILHANLRRRYKKAIGIYDEAVRILNRSDQAQRIAKFKEAEAILESVCESPLSAIKIREPANKSLAQIKMQLGVDRGMSDRTLEGYTDAVEFLRRAHELDPESRQIAARLKEYEGYLKRMQENSPPPARPQE